MNTQKSPTLDDLKLYCTNQISQITHDVNKYIWSRTHRGVLCLDDLLAFCFYEDYNLVWVIKSGKSSVSVMFFVTNVGDCVHMKPDEDPWEYEKKLKDSSIEIKDLSFDVLVNLAYYLDNFDASPIRLALESSLA
jgi:hypothetical protein